MLKVSAHCFQVSSALFLVTIGKMEAK